MHLALNVKLKVEESDKIRLFDTFKAWKYAWQVVADWSFKHDLSISQMLAHHATYYPIRKVCPDLQANLVQSARKDALAKVRSAKSNNHKLTASPKIKNSYIKYDGRTCSIKQDRLTLSVCGGKRITVEFQEFERLKIFRQKYKTVSPVVFYRDGQFWASFIFEIEEDVPKDKTVIGLDLGQRNFVATSEGKLYKSKTLNRNRRKIRFLKRQLQNKGTKSSRRHLRRIRKKEKRQSCDAVHCLVNQVIRESKASVLAIESLKLPSFKGFKNQKKAKNRRKYAIPFGLFTTILSYKALIQGKKVVRVSPYLTSQQDCRGLENGKRIGRLYVGVDGKHLNADINAACNIAIKASEKFELENPFVPQGYERQAGVTQPIVCKSLVSLDAEVLQAPEFIRG